MGHGVVVADNLARRSYDEELGHSSLRGRPHRCDPTTRRSPIGKGTS
jgi:hypothetical protein